MWLGQQRKYRSHNRYYTEQLPIWLLSGCDGRKSTWIEHQQPPITRHVYQRPKLEIYVEIKAQESMHLNEFGFPGISHPEITMHQVVWGRLEIDRVTGIASSSLPKFARGINVTYCANVRALGRIQTKTIDHRDIQGL